MVVLKRLAVLCAALSAAAPEAAAHDAWMEATVVDQAEERGGRAARVAFFIGHAGEVEPWTAAPHRVASFFSLGPGGLSDHQPSLIGSAPKTEARLQLDHGGPAVLALTTFRAVSVLPAERFNAYVAEAGVLPIARHRAATGAVNAPGREVYSRHMKALIGLGAPGCAHERLSAPAGQLLEIIPLTEPSPACGEGPMRFEVRYHGAPVGDVTLHLHRTDASAPATSMQTNAEGRAAFDRPDAGRWYVHAIWAEPLDGGAGQDADYATAFASLSFNLGALE